MPTSDDPISNSFHAASTFMRSLIAARKLRKENLQDSDISDAIDVIGDSAKAGAETDRLEAVSLLGKAAEISKPVATKVRPYIESGLKIPLPHTGQWGSAEDRYYLAKAVSLGNESWISSYAAVELAQGDIAEQSSREVWAEIAVNRSDTLATVLQLSAKALSEDRHKLGYSVDTTSRKLNRLIAAIVKPMPIADVPTGDGFGAAFAELISQAGGRQGPETRSVREETALKTLDLLIQTLRLKFDATLDSDVYRAAAIVLAWWKPAQPPAPIESRAERIARIAMDGIHVLGRQGVLQKSMREALVSAFGTESIDRLGNAITSNDPSLDPAIASWISTGRTLGETRTNVAVREVNEQAFDETVAKLLLAIDGLDGGPQSLELVADDIEVLEPKHATTVRAGAKRAKLIAQWALAIGSSRRLSLLGERGQIVPFDPALHETDDNIQLSSPARVRMPGVTKQLEGRPATIVLKAHVEKP